jgi:hypothetical protein
MAQVAGSRGREAQGKEPRMRTIAGEWDKFVMLVLPPDAPQIQRTEMRRAFYAGVESALRMQWDAGEEKVSEDQAMALFTAWHDECQRFAADVAAGKA